MYEETSNPEKESPVETPSTELPFTAVEKVTTGEHQEPSGEAHVKPSIDSASCHQHDKLQSTVTVAQAMSEESIRVGKADQHGSAFTEVAPSVQPAEVISPSALDKGGHQTANIDMLMDVSLPVSIELGRTRMTISDILELGCGSIVELDRLAGEPVDILINNKMLAKGEVVVLDENFGVRITSLVSPSERLERLKS
jgi:flagellar motor switch protein FliN/FliY